MPARNVYIALVVIFVSLFIAFKTSVKDQIFRGVASQLQNESLYDTTPDQLLQGALAGMTDAVGDHYTAYIPPEEKTDYMREIQGQFAGVGLGHFLKDGETGEISIENPIFRPAILHYIRGSRGVSENDTGSRQFKVYYLEDYTQELAEAHVIGSIERRDGEQTLIGGKFSLENLYNTVFGVIDEEFLGEEILLNKAE